MQKYRAASSSTGDRSVRIDHLKPLNYLELECQQMQQISDRIHRKVTISEQENNQQRIRLDELAQSLPQEAFSEIQLNLEKPRTVWVATIVVEISRLEGKRSIAIVMNAATFSGATDIDYFITNVSASVVTPKWIVNTYSQRNWVEVFYREAIMLSRIKRISSPRSNQSHTTFYPGVLCLYFYSLASADWWFET